MIKNAAVVALAAAAPFLLFGCSSDKVDECDSKKAALDKEYAQKFKDAAAAIKAGQKHKTCEEISTAHGLAFEKIIESPECDTQRAATAKALTMKEPKKPVRSDAGIKEVDDASEARQKAYEECQAAVKKDASGLLEVYHELKRSQQVSALEFGASPHHHHHHHHHKHVSAHSRLVPDDEDDIGSVYPEV